MNQTKQPLTDHDGEVRELNEKDFKNMLTLDQLPENVKSVLKKRGRLLLIGKRY